MTMPSQTLGLPTDALNKAVLTDWESKAYKMAGQSSIVSGSVTSCASSSADMVWTVKWTSAS